MVLYDLWSIPARTHHLKKFAGKYRALTGVDIYTVFLSCVIALTLEIATICSDSLDLSLFMAQHICIIGGGI